MRLVILFAAGLLQISAGLAQDLEHVRPRLLLPPAAILPPAGLPQALRLHPPQQAEGMDVKAFVAQAESEVAKASEYANRAFFVKYTNITFDTNWLEARANAELSQVLLGATKGAARYNGTIVDPVSRRKLDMMKLAAALPPPDRADGLQELATLTSKLMSSYLTGTIAYRGRRLTREEADQLIEKSRDPAELKELWEAKRSNLPPMRADYARTVELANEGARSLGFKDAGEMWRSSYDMAPEAFAELVDRLWGQIAPVYQNLMCYLRARLSEAHGSAEQPRTGPIRHDLLGPGWDNMADVFVPKTEAPTYDMTKLLAQSNYSVTTMVKTAENFFTSLGFEPLPRTFWQRSMFARPRDRDVGCVANVLHVDGKDDVRLVAACLKVNGYDFYITHHEIGHVFYYRAYKDQPFLFQGGANDGFHEAIGDFVALSAQTPTYLQQLGLLDAVPGAETDIPFLMRLLNRQGGIIANTLAIEKWRWDVFAGKVAPQGYNDAWWERQRQYQGIMPPLARPTDAFDPASVWHVTAHVPVIRYFLAGVYQFQFHRAACRIAGWTGPLHRCSIYGNKEVGARLQAMLAMGASKPWPEALAAFTGERELDASAMIEYFAPLDRWLTERNKGERCGW